ncbi:hypothetical protein [Methylocella sp. CPCC 101449]|uniref:hypothetical protein n=1 Tax=Methylocella sp. CPCC 101449 TaxID=2987531 RepID=UPI00289053EE|nr:hypothetical protein [Methylocella sp. CPCC 101449]MDT2022817.1 hypothetical protein [Methylocella sp. CPCC 101449]
MKPRVTMREALADPNLLGAAIPGDSWKVWRTLLIAMMGEALTDDERVIFEAVTGRPHEPGQPVDEFWAIVGRRAGKTRAAGVLAAYVSTLCDHSGLAPGERGVLPIMAATTEQADRAFQHVTGVISQGKVIAGSILSQTADLVRLNTGIDIQIRPANYRTIRGVTSVAAIADEVAFWAIEGSANPDAAILAAVRPSLATTGGPLFVISSPYARRGELWSTYRRDYGVDGDRLILVAKGTSRFFNSTLPQATIDRAYARDPQAAAAEYGGEFRSDVEAFVTAEAIDAVVSRSVRQRGFLHSTKYFGFADPSGGSRDAFTMAIAHAEGDKAVLDVVRERRPPFSPEGVVEDFAKTFKSYGITSIVGDRYSGEFVRELFRKQGISYEVSEKNKSEIYSELLPAINSQHVDLLDNERMTGQLVQLERRTSRTGKDSIDHPPGGHDDLINAAAGALVKASPLGRPQYRMLEVV